MFQKFIKYFSRNIVILIVEDEKTQIELIKKDLSRRYSNFLIVKDGESGLEIARKEKPDLIILDCILPRMQGEEVCKQLKDSESTKDIPVIFVTQKGKKSFVDCFLAGSAYHIVKPFKAMEILTAVKDVLRNSTQFISSEEIYHY